MGTVTFDGTRVNDAEALSAGNWTWAKTSSAGATATLEPDYKYQGTYCISGQIKTALIGFIGFDTVTSYDYSTGPKVWLAKVIQTNKDAIDGTGLRLEIGSDTSTALTNYYYYDVFSATTYPIAGGWQIVPIDPNVTGYRTTAGSPSITAISSYGTRSDANATAKAPNLGIDAIDFITHGTGLTITGATSTFDNFVTFDEGTVGNRYGIISTREGIMYIVGVLTIGTPISSVAFLDSNETIVFPDGRFNTGFCGIDLDLSNASTTVSMTTITMIGKGEYGHDGATADTRPDLEATGTSGTATIDACAITNFNVITLTSTTTMSDTVVNVCESLVQAQATISGCTFDSSPVLTNTAFMTVVDPSDISSSAFISGGAGHAIELTSTTGSPFTFTGNTFSGYSGTPGSNLIGGTGDPDAAVYNNSGGDITINVSDGDVPSVRNAAGCTTTINNNKTITITVQDGGANAIVGVQVAIFQTSDDSVLLASTPTDANGQAITSATASIGAIYIRARQSTNIATFNTNQAFGSEILTTDAVHSFVTTHGEAVVYDKNGGTAGVGLTADTTYYVHYLSTTTLTLHASAADAISNTSPINLTTDVAGETHNLNPVRYIPTSTVGTVGTENVSITMTMVTDTTVTG